MAKHRLPLNSGYVSGKMDEVIKKVRLGLVFSARKGNCLDFARHILNGSEVIHLSDYKISPCSSCDYECFHSKPCPIHDDLCQVFDRFSKANKILIVSPVYDSRPPALYYAFSERLPSIWYRKAEGFEAFKVKEVALILVGNEGVQETHDILYRNCQSLGMNIIAAIKIIPKRYSKGGGISGGLIQNKPVREQLDRVREKFQITVDDG